MDQNKKKSFRISAKKFLLTYPQIPNPKITPEEIKEIILKRWPTEIQSGIVAKELHKDGTPHIHIIIAFWKRIDIKNPTFFDFIMEKHGNYATVKSTKKAVSYLQKSGHYITWGAPLVAPTPIDIRKAVIQFLDNHKNKPEDLLTQDMDHKMIVYSDSSKLDVYYKRVQAQKHYQDLMALQRFQQWDIQKIKTLLQDKDYVKFAPYLEQIVPILQLINKFTLDRHYKTPNLLLWSPLPSLGKSSLFNLIKTLFPTYIWPNDHWYENYQNDTFDFIIWDEFTLVGQRPEFIKLLFAGNSMKLNMKGSHTLKQDNPIILCASNHSLRQLFRKRHLFFCECPHELLEQHEHELCLRTTSKCNPKIEDINLYKAYTARIHAVQIKDKIFPTDRTLWNEYIEVLKSLIPTQEAKQSTRDTTQQTNNDQTTINQDQELHFTDELDETMLIE